MGAAKRKAKTRRKGRASVDHDAPARRRGRKGTDLSETAPALASRPPANGPFAPSATQQKALAWYLEQLEQDASARPLTHEVAQASGAHVTAVSHWKRDTGFLAWWNRQLTEWHRLHSHEALATLRELQEDAGVAPRDRISAAKALREATQDVDAKPEAGLAKMLTRLTAQGGSFELEAAVSRDGDQAVRVRAGRDREAREAAVVERSEARARVEELAENVVDAGVVQVTPRGRVSDAIEDQAAALVRAKLEPADTADVSAPIVSDDCDDGCDERGADQQSVIPADLEGDRGSKITTEPSGSESTPPASCLPKTTSPAGTPQLVLSCPRCGLRLCTLAPGVKVPAIECPECGQ